MSRCALLRRLAEAKPVVQISAPAGSGKTVLLRSWIAEAGLARHAAWVPVDCQERDTQRFWLSVLAALRETTAGSELVQPLTAAPDLDGWAIVDRLLADLAPLADRIWLVIDDVHELCPDALMQLELLVLRAPPDLRLVLATRHDLRLGLHRLRVEGELTEIRELDLRFTVPEARELFAAAGVQLADTALVRLHERTEGWAAGLRLAALSMAGHPDPELFAAGFCGSDRTVAEYLLSEVLHQQPEEVRRLLLRTSILQRVNGDLADLLTQDKGGERILQDLERANAFVISLDGSRSWFRYHHLFADLLRLELRRTLPAEIAGLHRRAAGWLVGRGVVAEGVRHVQAAGEWAEAARLLADHSFSLALDGQGQAIAALLRAFPPGEDFPELAVVRAMGELGQGRLEEAAAHLAVAERFAGAAPPGRRGRLEVAVGSLRLSLARRQGHLAGVIEQAGVLAAPVAGASGGDVELGSDMRAVALLNLGTAEAWSLELPEAERHLREGAVLAREIGRPFLEVGCLAQLGFAGIFRVAALPGGDAFAVTQQRCREALALAERYGWGAEPVIAPALMALAGTLVLLGDFDEGEVWLRRAKRALETDTGPDIRLLLHQTAGMLHAGRGRLGEAAAEFGAAEDLGSRLAGLQVLASQVTGWLLATQARLGLTGQARAVLAGLDEQRAGSAEIGNARAVICLADGDPAGALAAVSGVIDGTPPALGYVTVVEAYLVAGLAHRELGDQRAASQAAERALALAEPDRLVLPFAMTGSVGLLEALPRHQTAHGALLADILDVLHGSSPAARGQPAVPPAQQLSPGELRVLRYLPTNLSRPEIAGELSVSLNTVSTHLRSIYAKLQVGDRSSAVRLARELRLLAAPRARLASGATRSR